MTPRCPRCGQATLPVINKKGRYWCSRCKVFVVGKPTNAVPIPSGKLPS